MDISGPSSKLLLKLMSASTMRSKVIANNIANQNVPGYKRQEVTFEDLLRTELHSISPNVDEVEPKIVTDTATIAQSDGNNVQMEQEMSALRENQLLYQLYATVLVGRTQMIQSAIHGDR